MGGSKCSSIGTSSSGGGSSIPRCGCEVPMRLWISNTGQNPFRKFWKCRNPGLDGCELLLWDDQLDAVNAANRGGRLPATVLVGQEFGKAFGEEFGKAFGGEFGKAFGQELGKAFALEFGNQVGKEIRNKLAQFVWVTIVMFAIMFAMKIKLLLVKLQCFYEAHMTSP